MKYRGLALTYKGMKLVDAVRLLDHLGSGDDPIYLAHNPTEETTPNRLNTNLNVNRFPISFRTARGWVGGTLADMITNRLNARKRSKPRPRSK